MWFVLLTACLSFIGYLVQDLVKQYTKFTVRTEVRVDDAEQVPLPTITACSWVSAEHIIDYSDKLVRISM